MYFIGKKYSGWVYFRIAQAKKGRFSGIFKSTKGYFSHLRGYFTGYFIPFCRFSENTLNLKPAIFIHILWKIKNMKAGM